VRTPALRVRLPLLVAGTMLPMLVFAVGLIAHTYQRDHAQAFDRVMDTARSVRLVLDSEMSSVTASLTVLSLTQALQHDDIEGFRKNAEAFTALYHGAAGLVLADHEGRQLINTRVPAGSAIPPRRNMAVNEEAFSSGKPIFSRLFRGSVTQTPIITIEVPVLRDGRVVYVLSFNPPTSFFQRIIERQRPSEDWTVSIFDQDGINFARVPNPEQTVGQKASPTLYAELFKADEAKINTVSLEGLPLLTAFTRSSLTGWTVAAGIRTATLTAPLYRTLAVTTGIGLVLLAIGLGFAIRMASRIAHVESMQRLLVSELSHRVKNTLATVQSIAMQTFVADVDSKEAQQKFTERLSALGRAHGLLSEEKWDQADLGGIAQSVMAPYATTSNRVKMDGPEIRMQQQQALMFSMVLHELATNALKYGALSVATGRVEIEWRRNGDRLHLSWSEMGGPPVSQPTRTGFGSRLITQGLAAQDGKAEMNFRPAGVICVIDCALSPASL
jgi:two-component sensor histidine kinase